MQRQRKVGVVQNNLVPCTTVQEHEAEDVNFLMVENPWKQGPGKMSSSNQIFVCQATQTLGFGNP